tara:strand:- start:11322 stop:12332 length:1011 start_codon:yes stop_codon:yes gene_type:complete
MQYLRQSTASQEISLGYFLDSTDGNTEETGLTIANTDIKIRKGGATTLSNKNSGGATHISNGVYYATLDATDTNTLGMLEVYVHVTGALAVKSIYMVLPSASYDAMVTNGLNDVAATDIVSSGAITTLTGAVVNVDLVDTLTTYTGNTPQTADHTATIDNIPTVAEFNARTIPSADYFDPVADTVANVTLVATTTANTDMRGTDNAFLAASYTAPDNAGITQIQTDISNLNDITAADVWGAATRELTSGNNIVLSKGVGVTGFNDIAAIDVLNAGDIDGYSLEESQKLILASGVGTLSGAATTTITINAADGSKARLTATVDGDGNRSAVIKDATG